MGVKENVSIVTLAKLKSIVFSTANEKRSVAALVKSIGIKTAGLSQAALAKAVGLNQAYISQMETGKRAMTSFSVRPIVISSAAWLSALPGAHRSAHRPA